MNPTKILYYPHYRPPSTWLRSVLLLTDEVERIVPEGVDPEDDEQTSELIQEIPGSLTARSPRGLDIDFDQSTLDRLRRAFRFIRERGNHLENGQVKIEIGPFGGILIDGHTFLHQAKVAPEVRWLLEEEGLILPFLQDYTERTDAAEYLPVPSDASNLVLSCIADRIARREGLDTATDEELPFATTTLDSLRVSVGAPSGSVQGAILSAVAAISIPDEISRMKIEDYKELRESYQSIRESFQIYATEIAAMNRLDKIEDPDIFRDRIKTASTAVEREIERYQKTAFSRRFKTWAPFSVGSILTVGAALADPTFVLPFAAGSVAVNLLSKVYFEDRTHREVPEACRLLANMRSEIIKRSTVNALL